LTIRTLLLFAVILSFNACGIFRVHHKEELIDFRTNRIPDHSLKLNGYYYAELEREPNVLDSVQAEKIKYLSVFFIYKDGFVVNIRGIDGLTKYYCAENKTFENTYQSAHEAIELMLEAQHAEDRKIKRSCSFEPNDIGNKGLVQIDENNIKIQSYSIERQKPGQDSFNSAYLYEMNGVIKSDSSFVIESETAYRTNEESSENTVFRFRQTAQKPNVENYFLNNTNRFK